MLDVALRGGTVVDGTGAPARRADVGVRGGRLVIPADGRLDESARSDLDVEGLVVAPGFVDLHTHYDAQLCWDPTASPSPLHGVTTVFGGNCGFALAPALDHDIEYLTRLMARVEGIPLEALSAGVPWEWSGLDEYLAHLEGGIAVNAGFLAGHSALRRHVMGAEATEREAEPRDVELMQEALHRALDAGALGLSSSQAPTHHDGDGQPVPSRAAGRDEMLALASCLRDHPGTQLEWILPGCLSGFSDDEVALLADLSLAANSPLNWNLLAVTGGDAHRRQLAASSAAAERGARVVALTLPQGMSIRLSFLSGFVLDGLPGWRETLTLPVPERLAALQDPAVRARLDAGAHAPEAGILRALADWSRLRIVEAFADETRAYEGRRIADVAVATGKAPFDALLDIVVADGLRTGLAPEMPAEPDGVWQARAEVWRDPRAVVGGSDAGAHLDMMCGAPYTTFLVGEAVRDRGLLELEEAVRLLTDVPAQLYGLVERGRLADGWHADLVVFDPARVAPQRERTVADLPGGASRIVAGAEGVEHVFVGGTEIVDGGTYTGADPGRVLRSGVDTRDVPLDASPPAGARPPDPANRGRPNHEEH